MEAQENGNKEIKKLERLTKTLSVYWHNRQISYQLNQEVEKDIDLNYSEQNSSFLSVQENRIAYKKHIVP